MSVDLFIAGLIAAAVTDLLHRYRWRLKWWLTRQDDSEPVKTYLLTAWQDVPSKGKYRAVQMVSETLVDDPLALSVAAESIDGHLLEATGVLSSQRQWSIVEFGRAS